jgi:hypothetical protein
MSNSEETTEMRAIPGGCHCGAVQVEFATAKDLAGFHPRECDCSFCRRHGATWLSDAEGRLRISEHAHGMLGDYRQGSEAARFLLCARCGVCVAVIFEEGARRFGAVNANCLESGSDFGVALPASPQMLSAEEKIARWKALWIADVVVSRAES